MRPRLSTLLTDTGLGLVLAILVATLMATEAPAVTAQRSTSDGLRVSFRSGVPSGFQQHFWACIAAFKAAGGLGAMTVTELRGVPLTLGYQPDPTGDTTSPIFPKGWNKASGNKGLPVQIDWDDRTGGTYAGGGSIIPCSALIHELTHAVDLFRGYVSLADNPENNAARYWYDEGLAVRAENWWIWHVDKTTGATLDQRRAYEGTPMPRWALWPAALNVSPGPWPPDGAGAHARKPTPGSCRGGGGIDQVLHGEFYRGSSTMGWGAGKVEVTANDGSPKQQAAVGYDSESVTSYGHYRCGTTVTLRATAARGDHFDRWSSPQGVCVVQGSRCSFVMSSKGVAINVYFALTVFPLKVRNTNPAGGYVTAGGNDLYSPISCGDVANGDTITPYTACSTTARRQQNEGDIIEVTLQATNDLSYGGWQIASLNGCESTVYNATSYNGQPLPHGVANCYISLNAPDIVRVTWEETYPPG